MGQAGIEQTYDRYLQGHGRRRRSSRSTRSGGRRARSEPTVAAAAQGNTLRLTIDIRLQRAAERALRDGIELARTAGETYADGGAIVALDPRDGAVLAMASNPTYQPSVYVSRDPSKLAPLQNPKVAEAENFPGLNRAIDVFYPPGSAWKPVTALAAMQEHILSPTETLQCTPSFTFYKQTFNNWDPYVNQPMELPQALAESCDTYFYRVGAAVLRPRREPRPRRCSSGPSRFGFGADTGIDIGPESAGLVPTPGVAAAALRRPAVRRDRPDLEARLLGPARDRPGRPRGDADPDGALLRDDRERRPAGDAAHRAGRRAADERPARRRRCCASSRRSSRPRAASTRRRSRPCSRGSTPARTRALGTSYGVFGQFPVSIAGKTGTAEKLITLPGYPNPVKLNQSWWCGYGPTDDPVDRRLRRDRERRPRRHRGGAGGAAGVRGVLPQARRDHDRTSRTDATDGDRSRRHPRTRPAEPLARRGRTGSSASPGRLDWVLLGARRGRGRVTASGRSAGSPATTRAGAPRPARRSTPPSGTVVLVVAILIDPASTGALEGDLRRPAAA